MARNTGNVTGNLQTTIAGTVTAGSMDVFIPEIWSDESLEALEFAANIQKYCDRHFESQLKVGDTLHVPRISNLQALDKAKDTDVTFEVVTETNQDITCALHKYAAFLIEDIVDAQANQDVRGPYTKKLGYALSRTIETGLSAMFASFSQTVGTLGVELTSDDYLRSYQYMLEVGLLEDSPQPGGDFCTFVTPAGYAAILKVDAFINSLYNKSADSIQGVQVGNVYGIPVKISNLLTSNGAGYDSVMMHKTQIALIISQQIKTESDHLIWKMGDAIVASCVYGAAEMNYPPEDAEQGGSTTANDKRGVWLKSV